MTDEFNLSEKIIIAPNKISGLILKQDVKEFIKRVKDTLMNTGEMNEAGDIDSHKIYIGEIFNILNQLAGDKLNGSK